ncbi:MAG: PBP1A family penicillin-binding protein [Chthoniobacterales bacterium]|nr:PBP1A family penicillin-binding protein [Chthoniobacterales bacterium]
MRNVKKSPLKKKKKRTKFFTFFKLGVALLLLWAMVGGFYYLWALTFDLSKIGTMSQRSLIYDRSGVVYSLAGGENREIVPFDKVSNDFINALISREDARFYQHHGVDPIGISRAVARNLLLGGIHQGGSTITQQLARNSFPLGGQTLHRKLLEAALAFRIETELSKEKILELYMNRIYFGPGLYGVQAASQAYFGRPAAQMTLAQGALLAGLIRSPNHLSPYNNLPGALQQQHLVLQRMKELGLITAEEQAKALNEKIPTPASRLVHFQNSWAVDAILHELSQVVPPEKIDGTPLRIMTTIDAKLQQSAEKSVAIRLAEIEQRSDFKESHRLKNTASSKSKNKKNIPATEEKLPPLQGALLAIDNASGGIVAIVGGRDYKTSKYNRATTAERQVGSAAKPFVYEEALRLGMSPDSLVNDARLTPADLPEAFKNYNPQNSDGTFGGWLPASHGLIHSRNTMSIRVGLGAGLQDVASTMQRLGLAETIPPYPSICLGSFESTLRKITTAYTALATGGERLQAHLIEEVTDSDGNILFRATRGRLSVLDPQATRTTTSILERVLTEGTASRAHALGLNKPAAGKTGTTDYFYDAWFIGYTQGLTCGVWVGFDKPQTIMHGGYGAELALPIWVDFIESSGTSQYPAGALL